MFADLLTLSIRVKVGRMKKRIAKGCFCRVRLDHAVVTMGWSDCFPQATIHHLTDAGSDHSPILLRWEEERGHSLSRAC